MIRNHARLFSILFVIILVIAAFVIFLLPGLTRYKTVIYSNGVGSDFTLKFYSKHEKVKGVDGESNLYSLVSTKSMYGKAPIELYIVQSTLPNNQFSSASSQNCRGMTSAFVVKNKFLNSSIQVCSVEENGVPSLYLAYFKYNDTTYLATIDQPYGSLSAAETKAHYSGLSTEFPGFGVAPYEGAAKKMLGSLKVLD